MLPEGDDDRILKAAGRLLQRSVAELTILGDEPAVRARAAELGVDLSAADVIDPRTSELCDQFAEQYAELRKHKGVTVEQAREIIHDVSYFGTMLVHNDMVDGMVSGANAHHGAHGEAGVRDHQDAARRVDRVEHLPDVSRRRGARLRRLRDRARPDGRTARRHRDLVGPHGGPVRHRTEGGDAVVLDGHVGYRCRRRQGQGRQRNWCVQREPDLLVEGPIQYDAAVEPSVAATKMPDSKVAGRATVLIFPDLNTGNNTYKAVQRSAGAIAIGPVLQGLNKPVNDLSRGALVEDIVNTVAITAIQAQGK